MLVISKGLPGSPSSGVLQPGDILVRVNGHDVTSSSRWRRCSMTMSAVPSTGAGTRWPEHHRQAAHHGSALRFTPDSYLQFSDGVLQHPLLRTGPAVQCPRWKGVYVANPGYALGAAGIARGSVIVAINSKPVNNLDDLEKILDTLGDGARATVRYFSLDDPRSTQLRSFRMDRRWFLSGRCLVTTTSDCGTVPTCRSWPPPRPGAGGTPLPYSTPIRG